MESCDVFFYNVGLKLGVDRIHEMADAIGLGKVTGIDLPAEQKGIIPSTEWKQKRFGEPWYDGETVSVSIGQGAVWLTPIQLAQLSSFVANDGKNFKPQIVNRIVSTDRGNGESLSARRQRGCETEKGYIRIVKDGMQGRCQRTERHCLQLTRRQMSP